MTTTATEPTTRTLDVPGATLTYDVRPNDQTTEPPLFLIGSPMGAGGFATLAGHFPDRTVVTYDPRGVERSISARSGHADHARGARRRPARIIEELGAGPVDLFASSGGAVNALALVAKHPDDVRTPSRTSRRSPRSCPTASRRSPPTARSTTRTRPAASAPAWRSSCRS